MCVWGTELLTTELYVTEPKFFEVEVAMENLKEYKLSGIDQIPVELIHTGINVLCSAIHILTDSIWHKEELQ
jgi:hypothetical protein